jgi:hypothetical protein
MALNAREWIFLKIEFSRAHINMSWETQIAPTVPYGTPKSHAIVQYRGGGLLKSLTVLPKNVPDFIWRTRYGTNRRRTYAFTILSMPRKLNMPNGHVDFTEIPYMNWETASYEDRLKYENSEHHDFMSMRDLAINNSRIMQFYEHSPHINFYRSMLSIDRMDPGAMIISPVPKTLITELYTSARWVDPRTEHPRRYSAELHPEVHIWQFPDFDLCVKLQLAQYHRVYHPITMTPALFCLFVQFQGVGVDISGVPKLHTPDLHIECGRYVPEHRRIYLTRNMVSDAPHRSIIMRVDPVYHDLGYNILHDSVIEYPNVQFRDAVTAVHVGLVRKNHAYDYSHFTGSVTFREILP